MSTAQLEELNLTRVFRTGQVATILGCSPRSVAKMIDSGKLRGYRLPGPGNDRRVARADLEEFVARHGMTCGVPGPAAPRRAVAVAGLDRGTRDAVSGAFLGLSPAARLTFHASPVALALDLAAARPVVAAVAAYEFGRIESQAFAAAVRGRPDLDQVRLIALAPPGEPPLAAFDATLPQDGEVAARLRDTVAMVLRLS